MTAAHAGMPPAEFPAPPASAPPTTVEILPDSVDVPDLFGQDLEAAGVTVTDTSLILSPVEVETDTFEPGTIINQAPPPGTPVPGGTVVVVEVAKVPTRYTVPDVVGQAATPARRALRGEGFIVDQTFVDAGGNLLDTQRTSGTVIEQSPPPGTEALAGTTISIVIRQG